MLGSEQLLQQGISKGHMTVRQSGSKTLYFMDFGEEVEIGEEEQCRKLEGLL